MRLTFNTKEEEQAFIERSRERGIRERAGKMRMAFGFGAWLANHDLGQDFIRDTSLLPYPKHNLYYALLHAIANTPSEDVVDAFIHGVMVLPHYQPGVGKSVTMPALEEHDLPNISPEEALIHFGSFDFDKFRQFRDAVHVDRERFLPMAAQAKAANVLLVRGLRKTWQKFRRQGQFAPYYKGYTHFPTAQQAWKDTDFPAE